MCNKIVKCPGNNIRHPNRAQAPFKVTSLINDVNALTNLTMCFYVGNDVIDSHLRFNERWFFNDRNYEGLNTYLNDLTLATNLFLGNFYLQLSLFMLPPCHFLLYSSNTIVTLTEETNRPSHSDTKKLDHSTICNLFRLLLGISVVTKC